MRGEREQRNYEGSNVNEKTGGTSVRILEEDPSIARQCRVDTQDSKTLQLNSMIFILGIKRIRSQKTAYEFPCMHEDHLLIEFLEGISKV